MLSHKGTQTLHTARLTLRQFVPADAAPMFRNWANDPEVTRFLTWAPHGTVDVSNGVIAQWAAEYARGDIYNWAIVPTAQNDRQAKFRKNEGFYDLAVYAVLKSG